jgi:DNA-3-methyladenine glycosylase II
MFFKLVQGAQPLHPLTNRASVQLPMPVTRSAARSANFTRTKSIGTKRKAPETVNTTKATSKKLRVPSNPTVALSLASTERSNNDKLVPAALTFSFDDAKRHLIGVDERFEDIFNKMKCRPFEQLDQVDPFR